MGYKEVIGQPYEHYQAIRFQGLKEILIAYPAVFLTDLLYGLMPGIGTFLLLSVAGARFAHVAINDHIITSNHFFLKNSLEYIKLQKKYIDYLRSLADFCISMGWDNEMKVFSGLSYMLEHGYLSYEKEFYISNSINEIAGCYGTAVVSGTGCCRHVNSLFSDLLTVLRYTTALYGVRIEEDISLLRDVEMKCKNFNDTNTSNISNSTTKGPNHLITLVTDKEHSCFYDLLNAAIFWVSDDLTVRNGDCSYKTEYEKDFNEPFLQTKQPLKLLPTSPHILDERLHDFYEVQTACIEHDKFFQDFYDRTRNIYGDIVDLREKLAKKIKYK